MAVCLSSVPVKISTPVPRKSKSLNWLRYAGSENLLVIPNSLTPTESTPDSTYTNYPDRQHFHCTHFVTYAATGRVQMAKEKVEMNKLEPSALISQLSDLIRNS